MKIKNKGFTLIELMVTVAIIGILGAIAVPAYQDYTVRSQVTEGLSLASGAKVQVAEYYSNHGRYPNSMNDLGIVSSEGNFIKETKIDTDGKITNIFGNDSNKLIHNKFVSLIPNETEKGNLDWNCQSNIEKKYLPNICMFIEENTETPEKNIANTCLHDIETTNGLWNRTETYCILNGYYHNENGPAAEWVYEDGSYQTEYMIMGWYHRLDGPALFSYDSNYKEYNEYWYKEGDLHREDGPAWIRTSPDGWSEEHWAFNGDRHREGGPAEYGSHPDGSWYKAWYINDEKIAYSEYDAETGESLYEINNQPVTEEEFLAVYSLD